MDREELIRLISDNRSKEALNILYEELRDDEAQTEVALLLGRLKSLSNKVRLGIIDDKEHSIEENKINYGLLAFLSKLDDSIKNGHEREKNEPLEKGVENREGASEKAVEKTETEDADMLVQDAGRNMMTLLDPEGNLEADENIRFDRDELEKVVSPHKSIEDEKDASSSKNSLGCLSLVATSLVLLFGSSSSCLLVLITFLSAIAVVIGSLGRPSTSENSAKFNLEDCGDALSLLTEDQYIYTYPISFEKLYFDNIDTIKILYRRRKDDLLGSEIQLLVVFRYKEEENILSSMFTDKELFAKVTEYSNNGPEAKFYYKSQDYTCFELIYHSINEVDREIVFNSKPLEEYEISEILNSKIIKISFENEGDVFSPSLFKVEGVDNYNIENLEGIIFNLNCISKFNINN